MQVDSSGWLEVQEAGFPAVVRVPSVRTVSLEEPQPLGIVWHWTAGPCTTPNFAVALANMIRTYDKTKDRPASWHVLVAKDGRLIQSVPFNLGSWHVGRPARIGGKPTMSNGKWDSTQFPGKLYSNVNRVTIGVELENSGRLMKVGDKFYCWPYTTGGVADPHLELPESRAVQVGAEWFDEFPQAQVDAAARLLQALVLKFKWTRNVSQYGHLQLDPTRKEDPGPRWMNHHMNTILDRVFGAE